jgi:L-malate glycosyltransferase
MRICFLADGKSVHTYNWIHYFTKKGHQTHLISLDGYAFETLDNLTVHTIKPFFPNNIRILSYLINSWFGPFLNSFRIRRLVRTINPDILHSHYLTDYGLLGYLIHFPTFVVTLWGSDILVTPRKSLYFRFMAKFILNSATLITCDSESVKDECLIYCKDQEKVKVVLWGVDLTTFHEREDDRRDTKIINILSTRNIISLYNIDTIVSSIPSVVKKYPDVRYTLKWCTNEHEIQKITSSKNLLLKIASSLNVTEYIEFINKYVPYTELPAIHYNADIFLSVPSSDSSSISLLEAMACGLPVIVSDLPANHEWITDGWNGFIIPVRDPEKLAEAILQLIENPDLMRLFGKRNAQIVRDRADREKQMAHMEGLYKQLLENK